MTVPRIPFPRRRWTPVEEGLPDNDREVILSLEDRDESTSGYCSLANAWVVLGFNDLVLAWRDFPAPYKAKKSAKKKRGEAVRDAE